jgi:arginyl-tRNA synthetase
MVDLPGGRMKSREGTVVDADVLMEEVIEEARNSAMARAEEQGKEVLVTEQDIKKIALAALKFFIIKVNPQKRMVFNPEESLDMQGQTGPYVQNAYVRIRSIFRKAGMEGQLAWEGKETIVNAFEKDLLVSLMEYPSLVQNAAEEYQPSMIANYCYDLAKKMHKYYAEVSILGEEKEDVKLFRLALIQQVATVLKAGMKLLGIEMVDRM